MMKKEIILYSKKFPSIRLRSIDKKDIENLRVWKNKNRRSFFYQENISIEQQQEWYKKYLLREEDYIFMAEILDGTIWKEFGCLGYRILEDTIDLYNIIRGKKINIRTSMREALILLIYWLKKEYQKEVKCDVLVDNPAIMWYQLCGFYIKEKIDNYYIMIYKESKYKEIKVERKEVL